jgi:hypothetical protein
MVDDILLSLAPAAHYNLAWPRIRINNSTAGRVIMASAQALRSAHKAVWIGRAGSLGRELNLTKQSYNSFVNAATHHATKQGARASGAMLFLPACAKVEAWSERQRCQSPFVPTFQCAWLTSAMVAMSMSFVTSRGSICT